MLKQLMSSAEQHPFYLPQTVLLLLLLLLLLGWSDLQLEQTFTNKSSMLCRFLATEGYRELAWSAIGWILVRGWMTWWPGWVEGWRCQCVVDFFIFFWCEPIVGISLILNISWNSRILSGLKHHFLSATFFKVSTDQLVCGLIWGIRRSVFSSVKPEDLKIMQKRMQSLPRLITHGLVLFCTKHTKYIQIQSLWIDHVTIDYSVL